MFSKLFGSKIEDIKQEDKNYLDVLSVSPYKPMAYLDFGERDGKLVDNHQTEIQLSDIPPRILSDLLDKDDVYVMTKRPDSPEQALPESKRLILIEKDDQISVAGTRVFHLSALREILQENRVIAAKMIQSGRRKLGVGIHVFNLENPFDDHTVFQFVKIVSRCTTGWNKSERALIDACFSDSQFVSYEPDTSKDEIHLPNSQAEFYKEFSKQKNKSDEARFELIKTLTVQHKMSIPGISKDAHR